MELLSHQSYLSLPEEPGVYIFLGKAREILYVGKAKNLKKRVSGYFTKKDLDTKTTKLVSQIKYIKYTIVQSELESLILEANQIQKYKPKYNLRLTDGKSYIRIKITIKDEAPKIVLARKGDDPKALYFGPFPTTNEVKLVLKLLRRVFPYQSVLNHGKKYCLYNHLGLCPCPPMFTKAEEFSSYKKDIKRIIKFLEGKSKNLVRDLEKERERLSKIEKFEEAQIVQNKLNAIESITTNFRSPFEYDKNPQLLKKLRKNQINELINILKKNGIKIKNLKRIECFDISNISGKYATGSMIVFKDGIKDNKSYRRFKIKKPPEVIPNDFAMMNEVLNRRLRHAEWVWPSLIIVDGGKGQVTSAKKALDLAKIKIPLIGIAKKEELLITSDFKIIRLDKNSPAILLVRRIRDEAHRFAITYHKKLRSNFIPHL